MPVQIQTSTLVLNKEDVTAQAHHRPQVWVVDAHLPSMNSRFVQLGDHWLHCNPTVCALGDHVLSESKNEQVKAPLEPTKQELVEKASQEAGLSNTVVVGQFFRTRLVCDAHGGTTAPYCK